ncbi:hybrid sensor histidine kinase/response regulator transcription factor [Mucilaginibacter sp. FT3.2]|uniref:hybrid sensor histidine kinase/response regulator transcription factor n=1 Tax=Mucilaginibacter sp. FT3.2 TaxID=2723090 RepID=UPI001620642F|nr:two-component regulator propeller domain-containing protein [Mucilaginibacter sp. FT3.2]MBB6232118.1 signal transduction histidine kinase/ligand-binding sensor domain-containing protein/DNA-binding response OmpR family regulator [Mucilaginibacter sp. FT3.2]
MLKVKAYVVLILLMCACRGLYAQNNLYKFSHLDITNGLSDNHINCILKDEKGFMWFGTNSGLSRYDGNKFKIFKHDAKNANSLKESYVLKICEGPGHKLWVFSNIDISIYNPITESFGDNVNDELARYKISTDQVSKIKKDAAGNFWFITNNFGLYCYKPQTGVTNFYDTSAKSTAKLYSNFVVDIVTGRGNVQWLVYSDGTLDELNTGTNKILSRFNGIASANNNKSESYSAIADNRGNLWVYSAAQPIGAYCYNPQGNSLQHFTKDTPLGRLNSNIVNSIIQADDGKMWVGTDHGGINIIDPVTLNVNYVVNKADDPQSLTGNSINLFKDDNGIIWAGTFKQGVNYYHKAIIQFPVYRHLLTDPQSLPYEDINAFEEDAEGKLFIGTNGGGLIIFNRKTQRYTQYKHDAANPNSLSNDIIIGLYFDHDHKLWIGTYFGGLDCFDGKTFTHYRHNDKIPLSITDDRVYTITEDAALNLWVGTFSGGLNVLNRKTKTFSHPNYKMISDYTSVIYKDRQGNLWIGHDRGIDVIDGKTKQVKHYYSNANNRNSLAGSDVNAILQDSRGLMWIGTKSGLSVLDTQANSFLNLEDVLNKPASNISNILEDNQGRMWVSTTNGLSSISLSSANNNYKFDVNNYNETDGLQGRDFNLYAGLVLKNGQIVFGGSHGFNLFSPAAINTLKPAPKLIFTDFRLFNKSVAVGDSVKGRVVLNKSIAETTSLTLKHDENVFDIEFSACEYFYQNKIKYQYTLEGFDDGWINFPGNSRSATYTNLDGGDYVFKVREQNSNKVITLKITVLPPFWKTPAAYIAYFLLVVSLLLYIRHRGITRLERQFDLKQAEIEAERKIAGEREEAQRMHQLDLMKIKFFVNISHEFRTPLSLILSPIDDLIKVSDKPDQQHHLTMIKRNSKRLLNLVNQLVDFRKMEHNELKLTLAKGDIIKFIQEVSSSFTDVAHQKQIQFLFESEASSFVTKFDHDKMERILFNLLSNAFKFTPAGGTISVILNLPEVDGLPPDQRMLEVRVIDTGIGITKQNQDMIFERFFQDDVPESLLNQGSGIGLSITKEFVKMHGGSIKLESEPDYGSCFIISLPVGGKFEKLEAAPMQERALKPGIKNVEGLQGTTKKPTVLLVEDDDDMRFYLKENLKNNFHIIEAVNGKEGWQKALSLHPKLIVSDISMPEMNGLELSKKIKADSRTVQIPIILLTAVTGDEDQLAGLDCGANDYIVKPFNFEILLSKIHNLLLMQQTFKETYQKQVEIQSQDVVVVSEDEKFLKNALDFIEQNITKSNFSVEELSRHLALSRVSLYRKLLTLTGKTPVDCIRTIRLQRAVQLLEKSKLSIANVAYEVGFNNAAYFAKVFKEEYGILPSEYITELKNKEQENILA